MPREYLLCVVDPVGLEGVGGGIDRMHEGRRRHPQTVEKRADDWVLSKLFEKREYQDGLLTSP